MLNAIIELIEFDTYKVNHGIIASHGLKNAIIGSVIAEYCPNCELVSIKPQILGVCLNIKSCPVIWAMVNMKLRIQTIVIGKR